MKNLLTRVQAELLDWAEFSEQLPDSGIPVTVTCFEGKIEAEIGQESDLIDLPSYPEVKAGIEALNEVEGLRSLEQFQFHLLEKLGVFTKARGA